MLRRAALLALLAALAVGCGGPPAPRTPKTGEQQLFDAADIALQCLSDRGAGCLSSSEATTAWLAQGHLELVATAPAPVLGARLLSAYDRLRSGNEAGRRLAELARNARPVARDLSCSPTATAPLGDELQRRRDELIRMAENLGLAATPLAKVVSALDATARALDGAMLVTARCRKGDLFVLLHPHGPGRTDDAAPGKSDTRSPRDWRPVAIAASREALSGGAPAAAPDRPPVAIDDAPAPDGVDPWIPVGELDL